MVNWLGWYLRVSVTCLQPSTVDVSLGVEVACVISIRPCIVVRKWVVAFPSTTSVAMDIGMGLGLSWHGPHGDQVNILRKKVRVTFRFFIHLRPQGRSEFPTRSNLPIFVRSWFLPTGEL